MAPNVGTGAMSNVYCYVGVTEKTLVIAVLETFDISHIYGKICIPFDQFDESEDKKVYCLPSGSSKRKAGKPK